MPTDLFFQINFSISIVASMIGLIISILTISIIASHRQCHSVTYLLTCNTSAIVALYLVFNLISSIYGLRESWAANQPACQFRAYGFVATSALLLYSHSIHAVSRFFAVVLYKQKRLRAYRMHWVMIAINWLLGLSLPAILFLVDGGYVYEEESRLCTCTTKHTLAALYGIATAFVIPFSIVAVIYGSIVCLAHRSTRRVRPEPTLTIAKSTTASVRTVNVGREMQLLRSTLILLGIILGGGVPYMVLVFWHMVNVRSPPAVLYLLIVNSISVCTALMMIALFHFSKHVKTAVFNFCK